MARSGKNNKGVVHTGFNSLGILTPANDRKLDIKTYNIHDIVTGNPSCPVSMDTLKYLIRAQASLHMAAVNEDSNNRLNSILKERISTIRGFVMHAEGAGPVAYAIYYPMIDGKGERVAYCEDFFIVEAYRGYGVANILFHELAKRTLDDNAKYLQWATDRRNTPVQGFVENKLGANTPPKVVTISANSLLHPESNFRSILNKEWNNATNPDVSQNDSKYIVKPITPNSVHLLENSGENPNIIRNTGDMRFVGYTVTDRNNPHKAVAIVPGWIHFSTFQVKEGIHLENPKFIDAKTDTEKTQIVNAVLDVAARHSAKSNYNHLRWHIDVENDFMLGLLQDKLNLPKDSMIGTPESELIVYTLSNGNLAALANSNPARTINVAANVPIGVKRQSIELALGN